MTRGDVWIEEYIVDPPSHILNGFIWALWGVYDYAHWIGSHRGVAICGRVRRDARAPARDFDTGWWSLYEARDGSREMLASRYYHTLHITQLRVMHRLTGIDVFAACADRFQTYLDRPLESRAGVRPEGHLQAASLLNPRLPCESSSSRTTFRRK